jgi:hypothetical protein
LTMRFLRPEKFRLTHRNLVSLSHRVSPKVHWKIDINGLTF